tara:strand:+ start:53 stop:298 length:246 start_codon:yes stop_codon:yes gene_type:complete
LKVVFLILVIYTGDGNLSYQKIPFNYSDQPITCEKMYSEKVKYVENPDYSEGNGQVWILAKYKNKNVIAHYCKDKEGNYVR